MNHQSRTHSRKPTDRPTQPASHSNDLLALISIDYTFLVRSVIAFTQRQTLDIHIDRDSGRQTDGQTDRLTDGQRIHKKCGQAGRQAYIRTRGHLIATDCTASRLFACLFSSTLTVVALLLGSFLWPYIFVRQTDEHADRHTNKQPGSQAARRYSFVHVDARHGRMDTNKDGSQQTDRLIDSSWTGRQPET